MKRAVKRFFKVINSDIFFNGNQIGYIDKDNERLIFIIDEVTYIIYVRKDKFERKWGICVIKRNNKTKAKICYNLGLVNKYHAYKVTIKKNIYEKLKAKENENVTISLS